MRVSDATKRWPTRLSDVDKFVLYVRWSLHAGVLLLLFLSFSPVVNSPDRPPFSIVGVLWCFITLTQLVAVTIVIERIPELASVKRLRALRWQRVAVGLFWLSTGCAALTSTFTDDDHLAPVIAAVVLFSLGVVGFIYSTSYSYPWARVVLATIASYYAVDHALFTSIVEITGFSIFVVGISQVSLWSAKVVKEIERARNLESLLHVSEERLRFAQELHDTLGQHLAALSVKTELAIALDKKNDARITEELAEMQRLIRLTRTDMGNVVEGYRGIDPRRELEGAYALLKSLGISTTINGAISEVPSEHHDIVAWFIRESTTNVMKHSDAENVNIHITKTSVAISNDGITSPPEKLGGLASLRQRAAAAGVQLKITKEEPEFCVELNWRKQ